MTTASRATPRATACRGPWCTMSRRWGLFCFAGRLLQSSRLCDVLLCVVCAYPAGSGWTCGKEGAGCRPSSCTAALQAVSLGWRGQEAVVYLSSPTHCVPTYFMRLAGHWRHLPGSVRVWQLWQPRRPAPPAEPGMRAQPCRGGQRGLPECELGCRWLPCTHQGLLHSAQVCCTCLHGTCDAWFMHACPAAVGSKNCRSESAWYRASPATRPAVFSLNCCLLLCSSKQATTAFICRASALAWLLD